MKLLLVSLLLLIGSSSFGATTSNVFGATSTGNPILIPFSLLPGGSSTVVAQTNFILNTVYQNVAGNVQMLRGSASLTTAAVSGRAALDVMVDQAGGTTFARAGGAAITTTIGVTLAQSYTNDFAAVINTNATYYLTNSSAGAGDGSTLVAGSGQLATLGFGGPPGAAVPTTKVYRALLTQSGGSAPTATVLENTLGGTVVWTYDATGSYVGTLAGAFSNNKTFVCSGALAGAGIVWDLVRSDSDNLSLSSKTTAGDSSELDSTISISTLVYP